MPVMQDSCVLELHQSFGSDYQTLAACHLKMHDVLDRSGGRLHGTVALTGQPLTADFFTSVIISLGWMASS